MALAFLTSSVPVFALDPTQSLSELSLDRWRPESGLPQGSITAMVKTSDGYLWLGTQEGLVRFDGIRFTVFDRATDPAFRSNHVTALVEGTDRMLWIGTLGGGLIHYDGRSFRAFGPEDGLPADTVNALALDRQGAVWVGTSRAGVARFMGGRFTAPLGPRDGLPSDIVRCVLADPDGAIWVGTEAGLARVVHGRVEPSDLVPRGQPVTALVRDATGRLWIGTTSGLIQSGVGRTRTFRVRDGLLHDQIRALVVDRHQSIWVGTLGGISRFRADGFESLTRSQGFPEELILALYSDPDGSIWIGTDGGGMVRLRAPRVVTLTTRDGLSRDTVYALTGRRAGGLWAGNSSGGVDRLDNARAHPTLSPGQVGSRVRSLFEDSRGRLWIGTDRGLLLSTVGRLRDFGAEGALPNPTVRAIAEDRNGTLWFGTDGGGLARFDGSAFSAFGVAQGLAGSQVRAILPGKDGELWIGTYGGLSCLRGGRVQSYTTVQGLSHNLVRCLHQSADGTLWIGTYGGGLNRFRAGRFGSITTRHGLLSDAIFAILEDDRGYLWMSCNRGIFRVAKTELDAVAEGRARAVRLLSLDESDGMRSRDCSGGSPGGWYGSDGRLYFGTLMGVVVVDPARLGRDSTPPPVVIEEVVVDGASRAPNHGLRVPPDPHRLDFRFAALSFTAPHKVLFSYQLEGFDRHWSEAGPARTASYTEIPPGRYQFHARASDREGVWPDTEASVQVEILPAVYQRRSFQAAVVVGLLATVFGFHRRRIRQMRGRQLELAQKVDDAVARIKVLRGLLPICANCKRIRDDQGYWSQLEDFIQRHSEADFSHSLCSECVHQLYPEIAEGERPRKPNDDRPDPPGPPAAASGPARR